LFCASVAIPYPFTKISEAGSISLKDAGKPEGASQKDGKKKRKRKEQNSKSRDASEEFSDDDDDDEI
jgi:hypothetical protein